MHSHVRDRADAPGDAPHLSRRDLLRRALGVAVAAPVAWLVAGCTTDGPDGGGSGRPDAAPSVDPDAGARSRAIDATTALVAAYEAVLARTDIDAATATMLTPLLAHHRTHLAVLQPSGTGPTTPTSPKSSAPTPSAPAGTSTASATTAPVPSAAPDPAAAVSELRTGEQASGAARTDDAVTAVNGAFARLLASIAACQSVHVAVLDAGAGGGATP